jgi:hypothetical protein
VNVFGPVGAVRISLLTNQTIGISCTAVAPVKRCVLPNLTLTRTIGQAAALWLRRRNFIKCLFIDASEMIAQRKQAAASSVRLAFDGLVGKSRHHGKWLLRYCIMILRPVGLLGGFSVKTQSAVFAHQHQK